MPLVFVKYTVQCLAVNRRCTCSVFPTGLEERVRVLCAHVCIVSASVPERDSVREMSAVGNRGEGWTGVLVLFLQLFGI